MDQLERDLTKHFERREPSAGFTDDVMAKIREAATGAAVVELPRRRPTLYVQRWSRWAAAGALAASLTLGFYVRQERQEQRRAAERAEVELMETLIFAGSKLNQARDRVWGTQGGVNE